MIQEILQSYLQKITAKALEDNIVSIDELNMLSIIEKWFKKVESDLNDSKDLFQGLSQTEVEQRVIIIAKDVLPDLIKEAERDGTISDEETALLKYIKF
jgi:hypothetical protein